MQAWDDLDEVDRQVMLLAGEEGMLWEVCATLEPDAAKRDAGIVAEGQRIAGALAQQGLLWFYRVQPDNPALTEPEVVALFNDPASWLRDEEAGTVANVCLFATEDGERFLRS
ncbi:hypothetical protein J5X84_38390 [Streptosporangiaceae bacterium NEAU-GS5]|nr:hypothetical protein [Streptosporangiaceae bacterium NEAU-GS5]